MANSLEIFPDTTEDEITADLIRLNSMTSWNSEKTNHLKSIIGLLKNNGYEQLFLKENRYHVGRVGNAYCYKISDKRRGLFAKFRGKTVRVICVASGRFDRTVMVKPIE